MSRPVTGGASTGEAVPAAPRAAYLDNVKLVAIVLVVCGHAWGPLADDPDHRVFRALYVFVYLFHMPLFVLVCGYLSRSFADAAANPARVRRLVSSTLVPYVVFAVAYRLFRWAVNGDAFSLDVLHPPYLTWFLVALFVWRVTAPLWRALSAPVRVSVLCSLAIGAVEPSGEFALGQVFQFLPFFVLGLVAPVDRVRGWARHRYARPAAGSVLFAALVSAYLVAPVARTEWLYRRTGHEGLGVDPLHWVLHSGAQAAAGLLLALAVLVLVPVHRGRCTVVGENSQYVYLLHGFVVQGALAAGVYRAGLWDRPGAAVLLTAVAVAVAFALGLPAVRAATGWAVEPRLRRLWRHP